MAKLEIPKMAAALLLALALAGCAEQQRNVVEEAPPPSYPGLKVGMVGVVLGPSGAPLGGCRVEVRDHRGQTVFSTRTAANGRYGIPWIPMEGALSVVIAPEGCSPVIRRYGSPDEFVRTPPVQVRVRCGRAGG